MITDVQVHSWLPDRGENALPSPPHRPGGYPIEQLVAEMDATGIDRAVLTPPTLWSRTANEYALEAVSRHPSRFAIVHQFDHRAEGAKARLETLNAPPYAGIRLLFRTNPEWLEDGSLDWVWSACERLGIPICARTSGTADKLGPVAERHPGLSILVDHMDTLHGKSGAAAFTDRLVSVARYPNIFVKMTAAPTNSSQPFPHPDVYEPLKQLYRAFGPQRLMWGSDVSNHQHPYASCLDHFRRLDFLSEDDREWILGRTAAKVLNWPETSEGATHGG